MRLIFILPLVSARAPLLSVLDSDSLLTQQPLHRFSCAPADGRPLSLPPSAVSGTRRSTVTWGDVAFGLMVGPTSLHQPWGHFSLESNLLKLARKT